MSSEKVKQVVEKVKEEAKEELAEAKALNEEIDASLSSGSKKKLLAYIGVVAVVAMLVGAFFF